MQIVRRTVLFVSCEGKMQRASFPACPSFDMGCGASKSPAVSTDEKPEMRSGIDETVDVAAVPDTASVVTLSLIHI